MFVSATAFLRGPALGLHSSKPFLMKSRAGARRRVILHHFAAASLDRRGVLSLPVLMQSDLEAGRTDRSSFFFSVDSSLGAVAADHFVRRRASDDADTNVKAANGGGQVGAML